ncbi:MAG: two-component system regulatory protein YycI [Bacilli bacterium]
MDWNRIRIIFIIALAALNLYLVYELFGKIHASKLDYYQESTVDEQLQESGIKFPVLPTEQLDVQYYSVRNYTYTEADKESVENQKVTMSGTEFTAVIQQPKKVILNAKDDYYNKLIQEIVPYADEFQYGGYDKTYNELYFFQVVNDKKIYWHTDAMTVVTLNEKNEMTSYRQKRMIQPEEIEFKKANELGLSAKGALEVLYIKNYLESDATVTKYELGYFELISLSSQSQIIIPMWHFVVNGTKDYYVEALEGQVYTIDQINRSEIYEYKF